MGNYYKVVNRTKKEFLDPFLVGEGGIKWGGIPREDFSRLVVFAMLVDWIGDHVTVEGDYDELYELANDYDYHDSTLRLIAAHNDAFPNEPIEVCEENIEDVPQT